MEEWICEGEEF